MTQAIASVAKARHPQHCEAVYPVVWVGAVPDPSLSVASISMQTPLDERRGTLVRDLAWTSGDVSLGPSEITLAMAHELSDGEVRWDVLLSGQVHESDTRQSADRNECEWHLTDRLAYLLSQSFAEYAVTHQQEPTLRGMLQQLAALLGSECVFLCDEGLLDQAMPVGTSFRGTLSERLQDAFSGLGLVLQQRLTLENGVVGRSLVVLPERRGREIHLPWSDAEGRGGAVVSVVVDRVQRSPRLWIARGGRPVVEETFVLHPGWDPTLEGRPDNDYARLLSSDFSRFGTVYRAWVLNEDGAFDGSPYHLEQRFDAGALFDRPGAIRVPLRLGLCLTKDGSGRRLAPIVECSLDGGVNWSAYPGQSMVMNDRAGVVLLDDALPGVVLSAAKAGALRLRVTASLTSPEPIEARRWDGNPFAGPAPSRTLDFGEAYAWRRVGSGSIHKAALNSGLLLAETADRRSDLRILLQDEMDQQPGPSIQARLTLAGAWTCLRPGDLVREAVGRGQAIDGHPASFMTRLARLQRIDLSFGVFNTSPRTQLRLD